MHSCGRASRPLNAYVHHELKRTALARHKLSRLFALLEIKLALQARLEEPLNAARVSLSPCETFRLMIVESLWVPASHVYGNSLFSIHPVVRLLLGLSKIVRSVGSGMSSFRGVHPMH